MIRNTVYYGKTKKRPLDVELALTGFLLKLRELKFRTVKTSQKKIKLKKKTKL